MEHATKIRKQKKKEAHTQTHTRKTNNIVKIGDAQKAYKNTDSQTPQNTNTHVITHKKTRRKKKRRNWCCAQVSVQHDEMDTVMFVARKNNIYLKVNIEKVGVFMNV